MAEAPDPKNSKPVEDDLMFGHSVGLSDEELKHIGLIVAQWGSLEHEIFHQTLATFADGTSLPREMDNLSFSRVLELWEERVLATLDETKQRVLTDAIRLLRQLFDYRNALMHGMLEWDANEPQSIFSIRVRQGEIVTFRFTGPDLRDFSRRLSTINFIVRYPGGVDDYSSQIDETGGHLGRFGVLANPHSVAD